METLFNVPATTGASQLMPENEAKDNYPTIYTAATLPTYYNATATLTVNNLNYIRHDVNPGKGYPHGYWPANRRIPPGTGR